MTDVARRMLAAGMRREAMAAVLLDRGVWTHERICQAASHGLDLHEETITQDLLLDIAMALPGLTTQAFTRPQEAQTGADWQWEWWLQGQRWFGLRVQAKRLKQISPGVFGYDFGYLIGKAKTQRQIDVLLADAKRAGIPAAYALYNGPELDVAQFDWRCRQLLPSPALFGVSTLPAQIAASLTSMGYTEYQSVSQYARPWSCLLNCVEWMCALGSTFRVDPELAEALGFDDVDNQDLAFYTASLMVQQLLQLRLGQFFQQPDPVASVIDEVASGVRAEAPNYVYRLMEIGVDAESEFPPRVGHIVIWRSQGAGG